MISCVVRLVVPGRSILLVAMLAGCGSGERSIVDPPPPPSTDFTLTIRADAEDAAVAQQLGWTAGLPSTQVTIALADGSAPGQVLTTGANGTVAMDALAPGSYHVSARRLLTSAEVARLGTGSSVIAFVGEQVVQVSANARTATVHLPASHRRSLVISEWAFTIRYAAGAGTYSFGGYLELYNNGDATVYLDGVLIADAWDISHELPHLSCATGAVFANDPGGAWASMIAAFPGSGQQYPLAPGATAVVATDAIDHSALFPDLLDLSGADFEFLGPADVDNPTVPNMLDVGTSSNSGHGMSFRGTLSAVAVLGAATDPATLLRKNEPVQGGTLLRIDRERVLDVFATRTTYLLTVRPPVTLCSSMVNAAMDREHGFFLADGTEEHKVSVSRKVLATLPDGRRLLQHTRSTANDFERSPRTPGTVPE